jgi:GR25 family glycosyltransferase involved in LPS biosynthesis
MEKIEQIYIINLKHRTDRLEHILKELEKVNIDKNKVQIIEAIYEPELGALGCAKSHIIALEKFMYSNYKNCLVFEDDFTFTKDRQYIDNKLNLLIEEKWDIIMFAGNIIDIKETNKNYFSKVIEVWTTSGYLVNKHYANVLIDNFKESKNELQNIFNNIKEEDKKFELENIEYKNQLEKLRYYKIKSQTIKPPVKLNFDKEISKYNIDQNWKNLQKIHNWYIFNPTVGIQYANYSDISKLDVSYNC